AVAQVDAVEIAHGDACPAGVERQSLPVVMDAHWPPLGRRPARQSNLRLGARTTASPFRTTVSPTRQRVARVTRRFAWSIASTATSARTRSPGRTGAMNFSVWPR